MPAASRPFLIGVAGGTCAGKTVVCERLAELAGEDLLTLIRLDSYQVDHTHQSVAERAATNYDHPDAYDWDLLNDHLAALVPRRAGVGADVRLRRAQPQRRSFARSRPRRSSSSRESSCCTTPALRERFDLKVYVDADADLRFIRRLTRDVAERGRTTDSIIAQYLTTVRPGHEQYIEPSKRYADLIVPFDVDERAEPSSCCWHASASSPSAA